jgi:branched-subunit amino acid transport protein
MIPEATFWTVTVALGIGTFLIRFSFLGLMGDRQLPPRVQAHLRYVGVAVLPAMVVPMVLWPAATGGMVEPARIIAAGVAFWAALRLGVVWSIAGGMGTLWLWQALAG